MNSAISPRRFALSFALPVLCVLNGVNASAQGTVNFENRVVGIVVTHVYLPLTASPGLVQTGNGPSDFPSGTTDWTGWTLVSGDGFSAQLFGAAGSNAPTGSLQPVLPITTFRTGAAAGFVNGVNATLTGVPYDVPATVQMRVWDNKGGAVANWAAAVAQAPGTELVGSSAPINVVAGNGFGGPDLEGLQSFNLTYNVPEPSAFVLLGFGSVLLWFGWSAKGLRW